MKEIAPALVPCYSTTGTQEIELFHSLLLFSQVTHILGTSKHHLSDMSEETSSAEAAGFVKSYNNDRRICICLYVSCLSFIGWANLNKKLCPKTVKQHLQGFKKMCYDSRFFDFHIYYVHLITSPVNGSFFDCICLFIVKTKILHLCNNTVQWMNGRKPESLFSPSVSLVCIPCHLCHTAT